MTQEDINDLLWKNAPQWERDQINATNANVDYVNSLKRKIERLEEKLKSHNKDYAKCLDELQELVKWNGWGERYRDDLIFVLKKHFA